MHQLTWLLLSQRVSSTLLRNRRTATEEPAQTLLTSVGWQSAYSIAVEILAHLPGELTQEMALAFLQDLSEQQEAAAGAGTEAEPGSLWHLVEEGRRDAFAVLLSDATAFLTPDDFSPDQKDPDR